MRWMLKDDQGLELHDVFSFKIEHAKGKPTTLSWVMRGQNRRNSKEVTLWRGDECVFKGRTFTYPTKICEGDYTWIAVAIDDTFQSQKQQVLSTLNTNHVLRGNLKDCDGAKAGYLFIHPVTHKVSWVSIESPDAPWDSHGLHERDSLQITPIDTPLKGLKASTSYSNKRLASGMLDVGPFISGMFPHGIETYSGAALETQWGQFVYRALRAGYDIHEAELLPTANRRVDLPKRLSSVTESDELVSIPYQAYRVKLLLGWAVPITTHTTVTLETGTDHETLTLSLMDESTTTEDQIVHEMREWMNAYATVRSYTAMIKYRVVITPDVPISSLGVGAWGILHDPRVHSSPIQGPIVGCIVSNDGGDTVADITMLWSPTPPLQLDSTPQLVETSGDPVVVCQTPQDIIESVRLVNGAADQYEYSLRHSSSTFETMAKDFPMTHIEIGLHPVTQHPVEYVERRYVLAPSKSEN